MTKKSHSPKNTKAMPPVKIHPLKINKVKDETTSLNKMTEVRNSISPTQEKSQSPKNESFHNFPRRAESPAVRVAVVTSRSIEQRSFSPKRSPRSTSPFSRGPASPTRRNSPPRKSSLDRRSPLRRSQEKYYSRNKSPSPYYKSRVRDCVPVNRSRSPVRRRSMSPRKDLRNPSPRYYRRRSRSPWSPVRRPVSPTRSPSPRYRSRSPLRRHSLSPRNKKYTKSGYQHSPPFWGSPKRRSPTQSPRRSKSPRKQEYSPKREFGYRRNSLSPKRKPSPHYKKYSPPRSPKQKLRSPSPKKNLSPKRRISPMAVKETRSQVNRKSRTPSLSLSPSPPRETKEPARRYKSPLRPRKESNDNVTSRTSRARRGNSADNRHSDGDTRERRKPSSKVWEREGRQWDRKADARRKDRTDKTTRETKREKDSNRTEKQKQEEPKEEAVSLKVTDNPVFEARRKKFESTMVVEPAGKKIRLVSKKNNSNEEKVQIEEKKVSVVEERKSVDNKETSAQTEDDLFSGREEIDEIDNFLNEDVLDLSAEVWSSDDEIFSKAKTNKSKISKKSPAKPAPVKERVSLKEKVTAKVEVKKRKSVSPPMPVPVSKRTPEPQPEVEQDNSDLRAALRRRREERLTKAGSLHEKLPKRLLQSAFESALGTKKPKKEEKSQKSTKESKSKEAAPTSPVHREKNDGRRVLVLKRPAPVRMQSAHINVTFPKDCGSESESSYSSSSSEDRYIAPVSSKRKLPVYMRLGTAQCSGRKVKLSTRRSQV
uniref:Uncharacterized protein n=1 Tax=Graphocephala atropunctata TaxID=36148 RepID=A0A1B6LLN9_9HEMI